MAMYEITAELNLKKIIDESREVAQAFNEFADDLERIEKKYSKPKESEGLTDKCKGCYYNDGEAHAECVSCEHSQVRRIRNDT